MTLRYEFELHISADEYLDYYRGTAKHVIARSSSGHSVQFPASLLQRFVTTEGIHGHFSLTCNEQYQGAALDRIPE